jgi:hypothetical protein
MVQSPPELVQVSSPADIYDRLLKPRAAESAMAVRGLVIMLGLEHTDLTFSPQLGRDISVAMTTHKSATERQPYRYADQVGCHLRDVLHTYPWLQDIAGKPEHRPEDSLCASSLAVWAGARVFCNYPGMFGITPQEAGQFRDHTRTVKIPELASQLQLNP